MRSRQLYALWTCTVDGATRHSIVRQRLENTFTWWIPLPLEFDGYGPILRTRLESIARSETSRWNIPCAYLGCKLGNGRYEPDPDKWKCAGADSTSRSTASVYFQWRHVRTHAKPYLASVIVSNALHRGLPGNPLSAATPSNLTFTLEFMAAVAELKRPGAKSVGICFESERPEIIPTLPDKG